MTAFVGVVACSACCGSELPIASRSHPSHRVPLRLLLLISAHCWGWVWGHFGFGLPRNTQFLKWQFDHFQAKQACGEESKLGSTEMDANSSTRGWHLGSVLGDSPGRMGERLFGLVLRWEQVVRFASPHHLPLKAFLT